MLKQNLQKQKGFTIVELLIVIVVIGILAALVLNTFGSVQAKARDAQRQTDVRSLATALEVYFNDRGSYPANINSSATLTGVDAAAYVPPNSTVTGVATLSAAPANQAALQCTGANLPAAFGAIGCTAAGQEVYGYWPQNSNARFTLYYWGETLGTGGAAGVQSKASLN
jgi:prepilin-type N-terminal cleavage/methylation domain-containing protein